MFNVAKFRTPALILKRNTITDSNNIETYKYETYLNIRCLITSLSSREYFIAKQFIKEDILKITLRDCNSIREMCSENFFFSYKDELYDITHINHLENNIVQLKVIKKV